MSFTLDLTNTPEAKSFSNIPPGDYNVCLDNAEIKETKAGNGEYINTKFKVIDGEYSGRFIFGMWTIKNPNAKAVEIGMSQIKSFMKCAGAEEFKLTSVLDLVGYMATAVVKVKIDDFNPEGKNVISYFKPRANAAPGPDATATSEDVPF